MARTKNASNWEYMVRRRARREKTGANKANVEDRDNNDERKDSVCNEPEPHTPSSRRINAGED